MDRARGKTEAGDASVSASAVTDDPTLLSPPAAKRVRKSAGSEACSEDSPSEKPAVEDAEAEAEEVSDDADDENAVEIDDDPVDLLVAQGVTEGGSETRAGEGERRPGPGGDARRRAAPVGDGGEGNG